LTGCCWMNFPPGGTLSWVATSAATAWPPPPRPPPTPPGLPPNDDVRRRLTHSRHTHRNTETQYIHTRTRAYTPYANTHSIHIHTHNIHPHLAARDESARRGGVARAVRSRARMRMRRRWRRKRRRVWGLWVCTHTLYHVDGRRMVRCVCAQQEAERRHGDMTSTLQTAE
jgi:hypothetical protein